MEHYHDIFRKVGVGVPNLLLPKKEVDLSAFSVIACDQFSAEPSYWQKVESLVGSQPSALHLMLPEAFLKSDNTAATEKINAAMHRYLDENLLEPIGEGFVYVERKTSTGLRKGLVVTLDLEEYDFSKDSHSLIRATEKTVVDRLPPRIKIRQNAPLEMPHVMVLIDDAEDGVIGAVTAAKAALKPLYDFELMQNGGHISGFLVSDPALLQSIAEALLRLMPSEGGMLYAMGDGNHSFAAAKACWELLKPTLTPEQQQKHPARFSTVELVNLYDDGAYFEPIHRLICNVDPQKLQQELGFDAANPPSLQDLQPLLDEWLAHHPEAELEYIHGADECRRLAAQSPDRLAVIFPPFDKSSVFKVVSENGVFVRKSFSIGHDVDKRYYLECKKIR